MGLYEDSGAPQEMYWQYGSSEGAYDPGCDPSPTMPQLHDHAHAHDQASAHEQAPLTPSSSSSSSNSSAGSSSSGGPASFVSPCSDRGNNYVSPGSDAGSTGIGSPGTGLSSGGGISSISSSGEGSNETSFCAGCSERIVDRFYLLAVERKWHAGCLRCVACHTSLDAAVTCFARDGHIFCRDDYHRLFSMRRCADFPGQSSSELVMRARSRVITSSAHLAHCSVQLTKGDHFGMNGPLIYCRDHYQTSSSKAVLLLADVHLTGGRLHHAHGDASGGFAGRPPPHGPHGPHGVHPHLPPEVMQGFPPPDHGGKIPFFNGVGAHHKGRPRKRKPKDEPMDTNMKMAILVSDIRCENCSPGFLRVSTCTCAMQEIENRTPRPRRTKQRTCPWSVRVKREVSRLSQRPSSRERGKGASRTPGEQRERDAAPDPAGLVVIDRETSIHKSHPHLANFCTEPRMIKEVNLVEAITIERIVKSIGPMGTPCQSVRTKRIRTSFKHHQLRTMKAYFALNHNPDAKDLKQLSQKTGLSKRVLQVWFQNARAKWRRNMISKDPKALAGGGGGEGGLGEGPAGEGSVGDYPDTPTVPPSAMSPDEGNSSQVSYQQMF
nr:protein apterous-like [Penaeus vannamei]